MVAHLQNKCAHDANATLQKGIETCYGGTSAEQMCPNMFWMCQQSSGWRIYTQPAPMRKFSLLKEIEPQRKKSAVDIALVLKSVLESTTSLENSKFLQNNSLISFAAVVVYGLFSPMSEPTLARNSCILGWTFPPSASASVSVRKACEVIIWSKFGGFWKLLSGPSWVFGSYYLVQVCVFSL